MTITLLLIPASAVFTFVAGAITWMVMPWHKNEWHKTPDEEAVCAE